MSRKKDREKLLIRQRLDPNYKGYRGPRPKMFGPPRPELKTVVCTVCGHKRNVALDVDEAGFVCLSCRGE